MRYEREGYPLECFEGRRGVPIDGSLQEVFKDVVYLRKDYPDYAHELADRVVDLDLRVSDERQKLDSQIDENCKSIKNSHEDSSEVARVRADNELLRIEKEKVMESEVKGIGEIAKESKIQALMRKLRHKSPYWADRMEKQVQAEKQALMGGKPGEFAKVPRQKILGLDLGTEETLEWMAEVDTPDAMKVTLDEADGILEGGPDFVRSIDEFDKLLSKVDYSEAVALLDQKRDNGEVTGKNYYSIMARIRNFYGV